MLPSIAENQTAVAYSEDIAALLFALALSDPNIEQSFLLSCGSTQYFAATPRRLFSNGQWTLNDLAQEFLDTIGTFDHFERNAMDVEQHCEWLALCFHLDGVCPEPKSGDIHNLIDFLVEEIAVPKGLPRLLRTRFAPGVPYEERTHPGGQITLLPVGTAVMIFDYYVFNLGVLIDKPPLVNRQAGYWIDPGWTFVSTFIDRFYACITELMIKTDREERQRDGYSMLEVMRLEVLRKGVDAIALLEKRASLIRELHGQMVEALRKEAYTEAVAIQKTLFTRLLSDALEIHERQVPDRLAEVITAADKLSRERRLTDCHDLWARVHLWRKARNLITHAPRESIFSQPEPPEAGRLRAKQAAMDGAELVAEAEVWSIEARARSLEMSLPRPTRTLPAH